MIVLAVAVGGAAGALLRWLASHLNGTVPWGTLLVNLLGSFGLGLLVGYDLPGTVIAPQPLNVGIATGLLGGLTTFSTLMVEVAYPPRLRWGYLAVTLLLGLGLAWAGLTIGTSV